MNLDPEAMAERREAMFTTLVILTCHPIGNCHGYMCNECGNLVIDRDAHFGHHLKMDNIDQRAEMALNHSHPIVVATEAWEAQQRSRGLGDDI